MKKVETIYEYANMGEFKEIVAHLREKGFKLADTHNCGIYQNETEYGTYNIPVVGGLKSIHVFHLVDKESPLEKALNEFIIQKSG